MSLEKCICSDHLPLTWVSQEEGSSWCPLCKALYRIERLEKEIKELTTAPGDKYDRKRKR